MCVYYVTAITVNEPPRVAFMTAVSLRQMCVSRAKGQLRLLLSWVMWACIDERRGLLFCENTNLLNENSDM